MKAAPDAQRRLLDLQAVDIALAQLAHRRKSLPELAEIAAISRELSALEDERVRAAGDPGRLIRTLAVCGGAGDSFLSDAARAGADAYLCADLRHHPASEHLATGGPALLDAAHWATERPWLDEVAGWLHAQFPVTALVSDLDTDPWTVHAVSGK